MLSAADWVAIGVTLRLCLFTTVILMLVATPLSLWLAAGSGRLRSLTQAVVALPLVLPPTVLGFYLLLLLGPNGWIGSMLERWGIGHLAFSFSGILIGSVIYSLPFAVQPLQQAFRQMGRRPHEVAESLGAGPLDRFLTITLPLARNGFVIAATLTFAHTLGEFGVILMIGGSIPGETHVLSTTIYAHAEAMNYAAAHRLSLLLLAAAFAVLSIIYFAGNRRPVVVQP